MRRLLVLDDDRERAAGFGAVLPQLGGGWGLTVYPSVKALLAEADRVLPDAGFIALEMTVAAPLAEYLARCRPMCPVTLHWRNRNRDAAWAHFKALWAAGWSVELVFRFDDPRLDWHASQWLPEARKLLDWPLDTRANRAHAANCERLQRQFEGREAIYVEKFVRRIRVSHIRANVDSRYVEARAEEILTPGLGAPPPYGTQPRWRFSGGRDTRFSRDSWSLHVQHVSWDIYFDPAVIAEVARFAGTLPGEEVYQSPRLHELIRKLTLESPHPQLVFPD